MKSDELPLKGMMSLHHIEKLDDHHSAVPKLPKMCMSCHKKHLDINACIGCKHHREED